MTASNTELFGSITSCSGEERSVPAGCTLTAQRVHGPKVL